MFRKIGEQFRHQMTQGASPKGIALTCAFGVMLGTFPVFGTTTALCVLLGIRFKLNQPILQTVNYLLYPVHLLMVPVFIYAGSSLFGSPVSIDPHTIVAEFSANHLEFFKHYGLALLEGVFVWALLAPILGYLVYSLVLKLVLKTKSKH